MKFDVDRKSSVTFLESWRNMELDETSVAPERERARDPFSGPSTIFGRTDPRSVCWNLEVPSQVAAITACGLPLLDANCSARYRPCV
jgi:hypothetical protein